ncbi:hypothetical protein DERP_010458 [Dermatophagoides pteronyssinus]|uniref:Uncharacterized protein n=1 Tax=Dermatophagoides pteronyssinus TaxID=6956 RepID=A0ABQ8J517_DERPT|nr:hypothetical protein DERP_010458 [Dermatophagoides pteronyssinus]
MQEMLWFVMNCIWTDLNAIFFTIVMNIFKLNTKKVEFFEVDVRSKSFLFSLTRYLYDNTEQIKAVSI